MDIINFFNFLTGKRYWFRVTFRYNNKMGARIFSFMVIIGLSRRSDIIKDRLVKKIPKPIHFRKFVTPILCNGHLTIESSQYLGYFKEKKR